MSSTTHITTIAIDAMGGDFGPSVTVPAAIDFLNKNSKITHKIILVGLEELIAPLIEQHGGCLLYTSPSPRDQRGSRMPSSA